VQSSIATSSGDSIVGEENEEDFSDSIHDDDIRSVDEESESTSDTFSEKSLGE
jgi:hypothetical protein